MGSIPITRSNIFMNYWATGLLGGVLIGCAAVLLLWSIGRIAGISGIVNGVASAAPGDRAWRIAFLGGMTIVGGVLLLFVPAPPPRFQTGRGSGSASESDGDMAAGMATVLVMRHMLDFRP